ncbi:WD40 repeat-containing protein SMU1 [Syncephalis pseudoplumigaleata]|uniref:WD40 repeat-containing protein SMU1 n=1 Tax=Syncephalis pseudoplumigaleata TaxID=1712513 RepID=A0A4P9Z4F1_9FUNG|nr:WD40 repeat-containing protein SMU1 [Syncephalis pseudoplumigaleata]|eukprot:RKP27457.1 WD40 repeat-containing protein SMU1 [Syncephalis pseudoplumigaleata]
MSIEIESADVIRLIQQFLKENKLTGTLRALQARRRHSIEETSIALNTVDSVEEFANDIKQGRWDVVLRTVAQLMLPPSKLYDLYEQIVLELIELRELGAARSLLRETDVMHSLQDKHADRYLRLERLLSRIMFDPREAYQGETKEKRRKAIAQALSNEVVSVPPSRLLSLLGQSLKWQQEQGIIQPGMAFDLFRNSVPVVEAEVDAIPDQQYNKIRFPKKQQANCCLFSPDGQYLVTGSADGIIEVWNYLSGKLRRDLKYQAEDNLMLMEDAVLCLCFNKQSDQLASGSQGGHIIVGIACMHACMHTASVLMLHYPFTAHHQAVTCVDFSPDGAQILSASQEGLLRIHGLKSGKMLKELRGHTCSVNRAVFVANGAKIISGDNDGAIKIWNAKTAICLLTIDLRESKSAVAATIGNSSISAIAVLPDDESVIISNKSTCVSQLSLMGKVTRRFTIEAREERLAIDCLLSPQGTLLYVLCEDGQLCCFNTATGECMRTLKVTEAEPIGMAHHPQANILAVFADNGEISLWKS